MAALRSEVDPTRTVIFFTMGIGPDLDAAALRESVEATGGKSYVPLELEDVEAHFLGALSERPCRPACR